MNTGPIIRAAREEDRAFILSLARRLADFDLPAWRTPDEVEAGTRRWLEKAISSSSTAACILVAERGGGGELVGFIYAHEEQDFFTGETYAHISEVAVSEEAQGTGTGTLLMEAIERWAKEMSYSRISLNVFTSNERARRLYERLGYSTETVKYMKLLSPLK